MIQKSKHIIELIPKFREIIEDLERIKKYVEVESKITYTSQDARMVALDSLQRTISAVGMWFQCYYSLANFYSKKENFFDETGFLRAVGSGLSMKQTEMIMFDYLRLSFITHTHFEIENLFYNILRHLDALPKGISYQNLTDEILSQCHLPKVGFEKDVLTAFAYLRNSLHNNGIHRRGRNLRLTIGHEEFVFIKDTRVECVSWDHIVILLKENVKILKRIIQSDRIKNIKTEIKDDFSHGA